MPSSTRSTKSSAPKSKKNELEEVTNDFASLKLQSRSTKSATVGPSLTPGDRLRNAMLTVNDASKSISAAVKSGWKQGSAGPADSDWSESKINKTMEPVGAALSALRSVYQEQENLTKIIDVERAALGVVAKLNSLHVYKLALGLIEGIRPSLLSLLGVSEPLDSRPKSRAARTTQRPPSRTGAVKESPNKYLYLLHLPVLPESSMFKDAASAQSLSVALATYQAHAIRSVLASLDNTQLQDLYETLISVDFLLTRAPPQPNALPIDQLSALYVGAFQAIAATPALTPRPATSDATSTAAVQKTSSSRAPSATRSSARTGSSSGATKSASRAAAKTATAALNSDELALLCRKQSLLILARSPSIDKDIDLFWDQALKWGALYVKGSSASSTEEPQIVQTLSAFFSDLIEAIPTERLNGPRFETLCDWWMRFAKKVKDVETVQKINYLLHPPSTPKRSTRDLPTEPPAAVPAKSSSTTRYSHATLLAILDRAVITPNPETMFAAAEALSKLRDDWAKVNEPDVRRVVNTLSDLRKTCMKCWDSRGNGGLEEGRRGAVRAVVDEMVRCAEKPGFPHEVTVSAIDALLAISRAELDPKDFESLGRSNIDIEKALNLAEHASAAQQLGLDYLVSPQLSAKTFATLLRAISNTAYTLAGVLYNAGLAAKAIVFVERGCTVGERALGLIDSTFDDDKELNALKTHIPRRWELLAICRLKAADRQGAVEAFRKALVRSVELLGPGVTLDEKSGQLVDQLIRVAVGELFDPDAAVLSQLFKNSHVDPGLLTAIAEKTIGVLQDMMHKPIAQRAMEIAMQELIRLWGDEHPIKKAKIMIGLLKQEYRSDTPTKLKVSYDDILELLSLKDPRQDVDIKHYIPQYTAEAHIWAGLLLHKSNAPTAEVTEHASAVSSGLLRLLDPPEVLVRSKSAGKKPARAGRPAPTAKRGGRSTANSDAAPPVKKTNLVLEDRIGLIQSIDMLAQVVGLLGDTLLKLQLMHLVVWLCEESTEAEVAEAHINSSIDLSNLYLELGQTAHATNVLARANDIAELNAFQINTSTLVLLRLLYADILARTQKTEDSERVYREALELSQQVEDVDKHAAYMVRTQARLQALQQSAIACGVYASIQAAKNNTVSMLAGFTQALRLWNRAVDILVRLSEKSQSAAPVEPANPFEVQAKPNVPDEASPIKKTISRNAILDGIQWQIAQGLMKAIFDLGDAYTLRGSVREAEFFLGQASSLSESLQAPLGIGRSLIRLAELKMARGLLDEGLEMLAKAEDIVADPVSVDTVTLHCFLGHHRQREASAEDAHAMYAHAEKVLDQLDTQMNELRRHRSESKVSEILAPEVRGLILKERIWLSQIGDVQPEDRVVADELNKLPLTLKLKSEQASLLGRIALYEVFNQFRSDLFLSSLTESAIAIPMGMTSKEPTSMQVPSIRDASNTLAVAEQSFWKTLQISVARGDAVRTREAATNLARILAFQSSLGKQGTEGAVLTTTLLDYSNATTLRQEMLEAIANKDKTEIKCDDLRWPSLDAAEPTSNETAPKPRTLFPSTSDAEEDLSLGAQEMQQYWQLLREKYSSVSFDASIAQQINLLPKHWTVVTINVTEDKTALIISRQRPHCQPVVFCLPLDRRGREADEDEKFDYDDAIDELTSIIETSDRITHEGVNIEGNKSAIAEWWSERTTLDQRMRELLENIEFCWLGVFKTIMATPLKHGPDTLSSLRSRIDRAFKRNGIGGDKSSSRPKLDRSLLDCLASISPKCRDEELEDLAYFILDLYQLHGVSVALSEVDVDTLVVDLRSALEEHALKTKPRSTPIEDHHMFLVLDKNVQRIPWESLPILRGQSVSRIPSMSFLVDRVQLAQHRQGVSFAPGPETIDPVDRIRVNPTRVRYILNPKGDLKHTEKQFAPWLKKMTKEVGWSGIIGRKPSEEEMARSLDGADLFIYFGHGGGEQFIRSQKIRHLQQCAATMLWGCSSGAMRDMGDFDPIGTPYNYMLAGCPTLVATLWDVTDRECDRFAQSVFTTLGLNEPRSKANTKRESASVVHAVSSAREACKLKYLTGAAPVVYGIPFYL
ncbi:cysteine peptidase C50 [Ceratobasidium sp. AG-Ba]|nr:cysteine peptidase C50 [Ceratobasidium sp. AG-Ba]